MDLVGFKQVDWTFEVGFGPNRLVFVLIGWVGPKVNGLDI